MPDPRFYDRKGPFSGAEIARVAGLSASEDYQERVFSDIAPLDEARATHVSFHLPRAGQESLKATRAGLCFVAPEAADDVPGGTIAASVADPMAAFAAAARLFYPEGAKSFEPNTFIDSGVEILPGCQIDPGAVIGPGVVLGEGVQVGAGCVIQCALIGSGVTLLPGVKVGQAGFGFVPGSDGITAVPQLGRVIIEDGVSLGAGTCVDRGTLDDTVIGTGTAIDNLVQIGHNVRIGRNCVIAAQTGISGSSVIGNGVMMGGQVGVADHVTIGDGARIGAKSGIMKDVEPGETVMGYPAQPVRLFWQQVAKLRKF